MAKAKLASVFFLILLALASLTSLNSAVVSSAQYSTGVNGVISVDTTWTNANSPYTLSSPVAVSHGANLTIEPGVTVNLNNFNLQVNGVLYVRGANDENIVFASGASGSSNIAFTSDSASWNEQAAVGCIIENAVLENVSISITNVSPKLDNNTMKAVFTGGHRDAIEVDSGSPMISDNVIYGDIEDLNEAAPLISNNSITGGVYGMASMDNKAVIVNNIVKNGDAVYGVGIRCDGINVYVANNVVSNCTAGIQAYDGPSVIERNLVYNNTVGFLISGMGNIEPTIRNNTIINNIVGIEIDYNAPSITIVYNNIENNSGYVNSTYTKRAGYNFFLYRDETENVIAIYNWWGTADQNAIEASIYDSSNSAYMRQKDYGTAGLVAFSPFLNEPNPEALPIPIVSRAPSSPPTPAPTPTSSTAPTSTTALPTPTATNSPTESANPSPSGTPSPAPTQTEPITTLYVIIGGLTIAVAALSIALVTVIYKKK